jgi:hypothetical protein
METDMILTGTLNLVSGPRERSFLRGNASTLQRLNVSTRQAVRLFFASDASLSRRGNPTADQIARVG